MKIMLATALAALFLGVAGNARADDWRIVSASRDQFVAIDASTIRTEGQRKLFWSLNLYRVTQDDGVDYYMDHTAIDCQRRTIEILAEATHSINGAMLWHSGDISGLESPIAQSSVGEAIYEAICSNHWPSTLPSVPTVRQLLDSGRPALERMPVR